MDYGPDMLVAEVTSSHLTQATLVVGDRHKREKDIDKILVNKLVPFAARIRDLRSGWVPVPDVNIEAVCRFWPILVICEPLLQTDPLWDFIDRHCDRKLFTGQARVMAPTIVEIDEFEGLMGAVACRVNRSRRCLSARPRSSGCGVICAPGSTATTALPATSANPTRSSASATRWINFLARLQPDDVQAA